MVELHELHYTKKDLARAPEPDRLFYLLATGLANDLQTLHKLVIASLGEKSDELIVKQGSASVALLMMRLLAGRLWEGWDLLKRDYALIEPLYAAKLSPEATVALSDLRLYFGDRRNLIATVRDKVGFHAEPGVVKRAFDRLPDDTDMGDYMCRTMGNTLFYSAEILQYEAINAFAKHGDPTTSMLAFARAVQRQVSDFSAFIFGYTAVFLRRHLDRQLDDMRDRKTELKGLPHLTDLRLAFFTELPDPL